MADTPGVCVCGGGENLGGSSPGCRDERRELGTARYTPRSNAYAATQLLR